MLESLMGNNLRNVSHFSLIPCGLRSDGMFQSRTERERMATPKGRQAASEQPVYRHMLLPYILYHTTVSSLYIINGTLHFARC